MDIFHKKKRTPLLASLGPPSFAWTNSASDSQASDARARPWREGARGADRGLSLQRLQVMMSAMVLKTPQKMTKIAMIFSTVS